MSHSEVKVTVLRTGQFIKISSVKSALSTLILIIPLALGLWESLGILYKALLIIMTALLNFIFVYYDYKRPAWKIENLLELMVKSLWGADQSSHFRSNIMIYDSKTKKLKIEHSYNMMGAVDRNLELELDRGCAGKAFTDKNTFWVDLTQAAHEKYLIDPQKVWSSMKSVMSIPIFLDDEVIGVLNIDSDLELNKVFLLDNRGDNKVLNIASAYSDLIAEWL
jgi:transcriptional regulator with GAF, ATPase, and Fis domain